MRERADAEGLSINQYLLACGLSDGHVPSVEELELRERAVFEIRWAAHELNKINRRLDRRVEISSEKVQTALEHTIEAARIISVAFGEQESTQGGR
ncbi:MAG: hypothetical protein M3458_05960 [Acidobacteriota bacterium]|nr:hypothetical protein [Acidobacteriota bacterium]